MARTASGRFFRFLVPVSPGLPEFFAPGTEISVGGIAALQGEAEYYFSPAIGSSQVSCFPELDLGGRPLKEAEVGILDPLIGVASPRSDGGGIFGFYQQRQKFFRVGGSLLERGADVPGVRFRRRLVV